jgi:hypothetical protein
MEVLLVCSPPDGSVEGVEEETLFIQEEVLPSPGVQERVMESWVIAVRLGEEGLPRLSSVLQILVAVSETVWRRVS